MSNALPDRHNGNNPWQQKFRVGTLDLLALRYAIRAAGGVDGLAITHLDRMEELDEWKVCDHYLPPDGDRNLTSFCEVDGGQIRALRKPANPQDLEQQERLTQLLLACKPGYVRVKRDREAFIELISEELGAPVVVTSFGMTAREKSMRETVQAGIGDTILDGERNLSQECQGI